MPFNIVPVTLTTRKHVIFQVNRTFFAVIGDMTYRSSESYYIITRATPSLQAPYFQAFPTQTRAASNRPRIASPPSAEPFILTERRGTITA